MGLRLRVAGSFRVMFTGMYNRKQGQLRADSEIKKNFCVDRPSHEL